MENYGERILTEREREVFKIMRDFDLPLGGIKFSLPLLIGFLKKDSQNPYINDVIKESKGINNICEGLDTERLDEETGRDIVIPLIGLLKELEEELEKIKEDSDSSLERLEEIKEEIFKRTKAFADLPARKDYFNWGIKHIPSKRKDREFYKNENKRHKS